MTKAAWNRQARNMPPEVRAIAASVASSVETLNEAIRNAVDTPRPADKVLCLEGAKALLGELKQLTADFPMFRMANMAAVEEEIAALERAYVKAGYYASALGLRRPSGPSLLGPRLMSGGAPLPAALRPRHRGDPR